jgi:hypothetical protein
MTESILVARHFADAYGKYIRGGMLRAVFLGRGTRGIRAAFHGGGAKPHVATFVEKAPNVGDFLHKRLILG